MGSVVRRDGSDIAERHRPVMRYFVAVGLLAVGITLLRLLLLYVSALVGSPPLDAAGRFIHNWFDPIIFVGALPLGSWLKSNLRKAPAA